MKRKYWRCPSKVLRRNSLNFSPVLFTSPESFHSLNSFGDFPPDIELKTQFLHPWNENCKLGVLRNSYKEKIFINVYEEYNAPQIPYIHFTIMQKDQPCSVQQQQKQRRACQSGPVETSHMFMWGNNFCQWIWLIGIESSLSYITGLWVVIF